MVMIRTEQEYRRVKALIEEEERLIQEEVKKMENAGFTEKQINISVGMAKVLLHNRKREVEEYEQVITGNFDPYTCSLDLIGRHLIKLRIWRGLSQTDLANKLGVKQTQVSRDERDEYSGASIHKIKQVLKALDVELMFAAPQIVEVAKAREEYASSQDEMAAAKQEKQAG
jgi:transcriptional regulator with XRE-family HTH domain